MTYPKTTWAVKCEACKTVAICNIIRGALICPHCTR